MITTIKITDEEKELLFIRAKIFKYKVDGESIKLDHCLLVFKKNNNTGVYHVLINYSFIIDALNEINLFKDSSLEKIMSEKNIKVSGLVEFNKIPVLIESLKEDTEKCFSKGNKSASIRIRKGLREVEELIKLVKKQSMNI